MAELPRPPALLDVLQEHLDEIDFLWEIRERYLFSHEWTLRELAAHEERIEAHLDGLRIGAGHAVDLARPALSAEEPGLATAATFVMFAFLRRDLEDEVVRGFESGPAPARDGMRSALRHCDVRHVADALARLAEATSPPGVRAAAIDVRAFHRLAAPRDFDALFRDDDLHVRRLAWEAAGRFGGPWLRDAFEAAQASESAALRRAALRASARMGEAAVVTYCRTAQTPDALAFLGVVGDADDRPLLESAVRRGGPSATGALAGLGALGAIDAMPLLLDAMTDDALAHAAGRAFTRITGFGDIEAATPPPAPIDLDDDAIDDSEDGPPPDPAKARAWWERASHRFTREGRWQSGLDVSRDPLGPHFDALPLETRLALYLGERVRDVEVAPEQELEAYRALYQRSGSR